METIRYQKKNYGGVLKIARPQALNALNLQVLEELEEELEHLSEMDIGCLIVTGEGEKAFAAGADIGQMKNFTKEEAYRFGKKGKKVFGLLENFPAPVIAAVNGYALGGGCELALSCDIRICSENAVFGLPETGLGILPGFGGTQRLARLIGPGMAKEMIYTGRKLRAQDAWRIGLVNGVYPSEKLEEQADVLGAEIARRSFGAVRAAKKAVNGGMDTKLAEGLEQENRLFASCFEQEDQRKRMGAFVDKRGGKR